MKVNLEQFIGIQLLSSNGEEELGKIKDLLFDNRSWNIRYLTVDTGNWLRERKVLIRPDHLLLGDWRLDSKEVDTDLTCERVENAPSLDSNAPVSRRYEMEHARFYGHYPYWLDAGVWGMTSHASPVPPSPQQMDEHQQALQEIEDECHLYSCEELKKYRVCDPDGETIGKLEDFIVAIPSWVITRLEVEGGHWFNSKTAFLGTETVESIEWETGVIHLKTKASELINFEREDAFA